MNQTWLFLGSHSQGHEQKQSDIKCGQERLDIG